MKISEIAKGTTRVWTLGDKEINGYRKMTANDGAERVVSVKWLVNMFNDGNIEEHDDGSFSFKRSEIPAVDKF